MSETYAITVEFDYPPTEAEKEWIKLNIWSALGELRDQVTMISGPAVRPEGVTPCDYGVHVLCCHDCDCDCHEETE